MMQIISPQYKPVSFKGVETARVLGLAQDLETAVNSLPVEKDFDAGDSQNLALASQHLAEASRVLTMVNLLRGSGLKASANKAFDFVDKGGLSQGFTYLRTSDNKGLQVLEHVQAGSFDHGRIEENITMDVAVEGRNQYVSLTRAGKLYVLNGRGGVYEPTPQEMVVLKPLVEDTVNRLTDPEGKYIHRGRISKSF